VRWRPLHTIPGILDVVGPRTDGRLIVASSQAGLFLLRRGSPPTLFARGPEGYVPGTGESYIALARKRRLSVAGCSFRRNDVYALDPAADPGIIRIDRLGRARRFADLPSGAFLSGIAFDAVGRFGHRLLVTALFGENMTLYALDCRGRSSVILQAGPRVEGGIVRSLRGRSGALPASSSPLTSIVAGSSPSTTAAGHGLSRSTASRPGVTSAWRASASSRRASIAAAPPISPTSGHPARRRPGRAAC